MLEAYVPTVINSPPDCWRASSGQHCRFRLKVSVAPIHNTEVRSANCTAQLVDTAFLNLRTDRAPAVLAQTVRTLALGEGADMFYDH